MMFCVSCGKKIDDGSLFCEHCGARQPEPAPVAAPQPQNVSVPQSAPQPEPQPTFQSAPPAQPQQSVTQPLPTAQPGSGGIPPYTPPAQVSAAPAAPRKPMSKGVKIGLAAAAVLVAAFFGVKAFLTSSHAPEKTINQFVEAIRAGDAGALTKVAAVVGSADVELNEETLAPFFAGQKGDLGQVSQIQNALFSDLEAIQQGRSPDGWRNYRLVKRANFLYDSYQVEITPVEVELYSEFDGTTLELEGVTYQVGREPTTVQLLPGLYGGTASCTNETTGAELTNDLGRRTISDSNSEVGCYFDYTSFYLYSNYDVELEGVRIDGKPYKGSLSDLNVNNGAWISPVNYGSEAEIRYSYAGMDFTSTQVAGEGADYLAPTLSDDVRALGEDLAVQAAQIYLNLYTGLSGEDLEALSALCEDPENNSFLADCAAAVYNEDIYYEENPEDLEDRNYSVFEDLEADDVNSYVSFNNGGIQMECSLRLRWSKRIYCNWVTDEPGDSYGSDYEWFSVYLSYQDGSWAVTRIY